MIKLSPFQIIGVNEQASDAEIKQAYLQLVKDHPPEREPQKFRQIQQAYQAIKDEDTRSSYQLFHLPEVEFEELLGHAFRRAPALKTMPPEDFMKLFDQDSLEKSLLKACSQPT
ncbi:MAG: J domain-containing protein [Gammaproteobacteria bacterium]